LETIARRNEAGAVGPLLEEWDRDLRSGDPLDFPGYAAALKEAPEESIRTGRTEHFVLVESRFDVFGGSMGVVAGEKISRAFDRAVELGLPVVCVTRSGGARMQEGMVALVQLGRTAAAVERHRAAGLLSIAVHRSPTTGGALASFASLCQIRAVEAGAVIGFAGPRVVRETTGETVGDTSHRASTAFEHGLVDAVLEPGEIDAWVDAALGLRAEPLEPRELPEAPADDADDGDLSAWEEVLRARRADRPSGVDVAAAICDSWTEINGTDPTVRAGLATIDGRRVIVVAHDRHRDAGRPRPDGFRLARRAVALADELRLPLVTLVDTPGADPSSASENDGIAREIAELYGAMAVLRRPSVSVCVGEGGSGGALALAWTDRLLVQRHAVFSVIAPEGAAAILERDADRAPDTAGLLGLTSRELLDLGIADGLVDESADAVRRAVVDALDSATVGDRRRRVDALSDRWLERG
jgi:acetyl-CoA carboxylase carboxyl transferase subunit beta